jgi:hypothetical protein
MGGVPVESWWTPDQLACATDPTRRWERRRFQTSDMIWERQPGGGHIGHRKQPGEQPEAGAELVRDGWDHEHCRLCWETISARPGEAHECFTDGEDWVCGACFRKYIAPRRSRQD